jgi:hypothetical protein
MFGQPESRKAGKPESRKAGSREAVEYLCRERSLLLACTARNAPWMPTVACGTRTIYNRQSIRIPVRKTYKLNLEGKNRDRLLEASKHDIRKYLKRERNKALPAGVDYWDFDTRAGVDESSAVAVPYADLFRSIDQLVAGDGDQFYVEVVSKPGHRTVKTPPPDVWGNLREESGT